MLICISSVDRVRSTPWQQKWVVVRWFEAQNARLESSMPIPEHLREGPEGLPRQPGCYLMRSASDEVVYVGKAKSLRARCCSISTGTTRAPLWLRSIGWYAGLIGSSRRPRRGAAARVDADQEASAAFNVMLKDTERSVLLARGAAS